MKLEKVSNGSYRVRKYANGKRYCVTFDHKPSQKEIIQALSEKMSTLVLEQPDAEKGSVADLCAQYLSLCEKKGLSPSTIKGYYSIENNLPEWFLDLNYTEVTQKYCQILVDEYGKTRSPKSTRLMWSFVRSILALKRNVSELTIKLPQAIKKVEYEPSTKDIQAIIKESEHTRYHIPFQLSVLGLRRGEICALDIADLDESNVLTINKDLVINVNNQYVVKESTKTAASNRRILIPATLADEIRQQGYIFNGNPHTLNEALHKFQDKLEIPRFRLHMLRHFAAAYLHQQGFSDAQILAYGGWENGSDVMKKIYRYNLDPEKSQTEIANKFDSLL